MDAPGALGPSLGVVCSRQGAGLCSLHPLVIGGGRLWEGVTTPTPAKAALSPPESQPWRAPHLSHQLPGPQ